MKPYFNQSTESAESRKLLEKHNLLHGVRMLDRFDPYLIVETDRCMTFVMQGLILQCPPKVKRQPLFTYLLPLQHHALSNLRTPMHDQTI